MAGGFQNKRDSGLELTAGELLWVQTGAAGVVLLEYQASSPSNTANYGKVYAKTDDNLYFMDEAGVEYQLNVSGSGVVVETPAGAVNSSNVSFTVSAEPKWVVSDGITYFDGAGYTYAGLAITMDSPPSLYIRVII